MTVKSTAHLQLGSVAFRSSGTSRALLSSQIGRRSYSSDFGTLFEVPSSQSPQQSTRKRSIQGQDQSGTKAPSQKASATGPSPDNQSKRSPRPTHEERIRRLESLVETLQKDKTRSALPRRPTRIYEFLRALLQSAATVDDAAQLPRSDFDKMIHHMEVLPAGLKHLREIHSKKGQQLTPQPSQQLQTERKEQSKEQSASTLPEDAVKLPGILSRRIPSRPAASAAKSVPTLEQVAQSPLLVDEARDEQNRQDWAEAAAFVTQRREQQASGNTRQPSAERAKKPNLPSPPPRLDASADPDASHPLLTAGSFGQATRLMRQQEQDFEREQLAERQSAKGE